jgi:hypothetical protein
VIADTPQRRGQCEAFARLDAIMEIGGTAPSARAAAVVLDMAGKSPRYHPEEGHANEGKMRKES